MKQQERMIEKGWNALLRGLDPEEQLSDGQKEDLRKAFFAGALAVVTICGRKDFDSAAILNELESFEAGVERDAAIGQA